MFKTDKGKHVWRVNSDGSVTWFEYDPSSSNIQNLEGRFILFPTKAQALEAGRRILETVYNYQKELGNV